MINALCLAISRRIISVRAYILKFVVIAIFRKIYYYFLNVEIIVTVKF